MQILFDTHDKPYLRNKQKENCYADNFPLDLKALSQLTTYIAPMTCIIIAQIGAKGYLGACN